MANQALKFKRTVNAPASEVYRAFTRSMVLREWLCHAAQADPRKGGRIYLYWNSGYYAAGEFTKLVPGKQVAFMWLGRGEPGTTRVTVALTEKSGRTNITLTHAGLGTGKTWPRTRKEFETSWNAVLENLQSVLETGEDLRFTRRPMLGVYPGVLNADEAKRLGVPVTTGVRLDGVADGLGAQKAGLQKDDVIVKLGKYKMTGYGSFAQILSHYRAGDKVAVIFYRGGEKKTVTMELSGRQLPTVPPTARELANAVQQTYDKLNIELDELLKDVSEAAASHKPTPQDWNAKETLAHLMVDVRTNYFALYDFIFDAERVYDTVDNLDNLPAQTQATVAAFGTMAELVKEYKRNQQEVIAMLAALPDALVAHKGTYWRVAMPFLQTEDHVRGHFQQMRAAIQAARKN